jgi:hypothetical protein
MTRVTRCRIQTLSRLRQHGTSHFISISVFALYERKNRDTKEEKYRSAEGRIADCVSPVNWMRGSSDEEDIVHNTKKGA